MAIFAQPTPDENLVPGWNVQGGASGSSFSGPDAPGYAQAGVTGDIATTSQVGAGAPSPYGAEFVGTEGQNTPSGYNSYTNPGGLLANASYSVSQVMAPTGTNPTQVGAVITTTAALTGVVVSGLSLMVQALGTGTTTYTVGGLAGGTVAVGTIIPAGAKITTTASGVVFVTVGM